MELVSVAEELAGEVPGRFWLRAARWFVDYSLDEGINRLLAALARFHGADRAWVMRYDEGLSCLSNSHEWAREGVGAFVNDLQNVPVTMMGALHAAMLRDEICYFDVATMSDEMPELRAEFYRQKNQAVLCLPLWHEKRLVGMWGYDAVRARVVWSDEAIDCLRAASGLIAAALARSVSHRPARNGLTVPPEVVFIAQAGGRFALPMSKIVLIESQGDYTRVEIEKNESMLQLRTLSEWENGLPKERFLRVHRRYLVNVDRIQGLVTGAYGRWALKLVGRTEPVVVGRIYRPAVKAWTKG